MNLYISVILLIVVQVSSMARRNFQIGDSCSVNSNTIGTCKPLKDCECAEQLLQRRKRPKICLFVNVEPVICCPESNGTRPKIDPKNVQTTKLNIPERISAKKCREYGTKVFKMMRQPIPILNAPYNNISQCNLIANTLINSGVKATVKEFPHIALIGYGRDENEPVWKCDGSLISEQYILTSANCVDQKPYGLAQFVRLGNSERNRRHETEIQYFKVIDWIKHPDHSGLYNDIGLLKLNKSAIISTLVRPLCLYDKNETPETLIASGMGGIGPEYTSSNDLQKTTLKTYSNDKCTSNYEPFRNTLTEGIKSDIQFCAGRKSNGDDICERFYGGPLQILHNEVYCMYSLVGIRSFEYLCEEMGYPGIYTKVSTYIPWIESIVWKQ